jgi:UDP-glucose 4-epimerase
LIKELLLLYKNTNISIISLDNYTSGSKKNHINDIKVEYVNGNTWDISNISKIQNFKPKYVFHLGEFSRIVLSFEKTKETFWSNSIGTFEVIEYCLQKKSKLIYSASSAVFSGNDLNPYVFCKSQNIELIKNYSKWFELNYAIVYFYNVYGDKQIGNGPYATVLGIFEKQYMDDENLTIVLPGTQSRIFTHIDDIVRGLILIAEKGFGDNYHLSSNEKYTINEVANMFNYSKICYIPERRGERISSIEQENRMEKELGWTSKETLKNYIDKIKQNKLYREEERCNIYDYVQNYLTNDYKKPLVFFSIDDLKKAIILLMDAKKNIKIFSSLNDKISSKIFPYLLNEIKCDIINGFGKCQKKYGSSINYSYLNLKKIPIEYENIIKLDEELHDHSLYCISIRYLLYIE